MNLCCIAFWKVAVNATEDARQQVAAKQHGFRGDRSAVVVVLVQRDHRVG
jgi:hypothetical protein